MKTVKSMWHKLGNRQSALLSYRTTPLASGYSPAELLYGRPIRSTLGLARTPGVDYNQFESAATEQANEARRRWDEKHRAKCLPELTPGDRVWVKSPSDRGMEGIVDRKCDAPHSYWVKSGCSEVRRNRKHLFLLPSLTSPAGGGTPTIRPLALHRLPPAPEIPDAAMGACGESDPEINVECTNGAEGRDLNDTGRNCDNNVSAPPTNTSDTPVLDIPDDPETCDTVSYPRKQVRFRSRSSDPVRATRKGRAVRAPRCEDYEYY